MSIDTRPQRPGSEGRPPRPPPPALFRSVWGVLEQQESNGTSNFFGGCRPAFDGRSAIFTNQPLPNDGNSIIVSSFSAAFLVVNHEVDLRCSTQITGIPAPDRPTMTFSIAIQNRIVLELSNLRKYIGQSQGSCDAGAVSDTLAALNTLFRHGPAALFASARTSFFVSREAEMRLRSPEVMKRVRDLNGGIELWRGFFQYVSLFLQLHR